MIKIFNGTEMTNKLKEATYLTIKELKKQSIILPEKYLDIFEYHAKNLELNLNDSKVVRKALQEDENHIDSIVKKTSENLTALQETTSHARQAIQDKDDDSLHNINDKLLVMQNQIDVLQKELFSDPLTNAYNRKWLNDDYLKDDKFKNNGYIAFLDLNKFKFINDNYGHIIGDQVLKFLVKFLVKELNYPNVDLVRYAGDEFVVLFDNDKSTGVDANSKMKEAQKKLSKLLLKSTKGKKIKISFAYGILPFKVDDDFETILETVDDLMYQNKNESKLLIK